MSLAEKGLCVELDVASDLLPEAADVRNIIHFWALFVQKREIQQIIPLISLRAKRTF